MRCGAVPTPTVWNWRGFSGNSQEYLDVSGCTSARYYVVVHSHSGNGVFSLVRGRHNSEGHIVALRAGTAFNASSTQMNTFANTIQVGIRHYYGSTEGASVIHTVDLYNSNGCGATSCGGSSCDICFKNSPGTGLANCDGAVDIFQSYFANPEGLAHELGHYKFCFFPDESSAGPVWHCGHSNMANPWGDNNNYCTTFDHLYDETPNAPSTPNSSAWDQAMAVGKVEVPITRTGDNFDYEAFDFNDLVARVVIH